MTRTFTEMLSIGVRTRKDRMVEDARRNDQIQAAIAKLELYRRDEQQAAWEYDQFANRLEALGFQDCANKFRSMARDERQHHANVAAIRDAMRKVK